jgi:DNA-binding GntR family transcriptional regulator
LAAARRSSTELEQLQRSIPEPGAPEWMSAGEQFAHNRDFHSTIVAICSNALLTLAAEPIFVVLQTRLARTNLPQSFHREINRHHVAIAAAIAAGDPDAAGDEMLAHLKWLRPVYERAWRSLRKSS